MNNFLIETEDTLLIQKKEEELIKKNKFQDAEISSFDIEETPLENALEALDTYGFLSNQKVIIIKKLKPNFIISMIKKASDYIYREYLWKNVIEKKYIPFFEKIQKF